MTFSPSDAWRPPTFHNAWCPGRHTVDARHPAKISRISLCYGRTYKNPPKHLQTPLHNAETIPTWFPYKIMLVHINLICYSNNLAIKTELIHALNIPISCQKLMFMNNQHMTQSLHEQYMKFQSKHGIKQNFNQLFIIQHKSTKETKFYWRLRETSISFHELSTHRWRIPLSCNSQKIQQSNFNWFILSSSSTPSSKFFFSHILCLSRTGRKYSQKPNFCLTFEYILFYFNSSKLHFLPNSNLVLLHSPLNSPNSQNWLNSRNYHQFPLS